MNSHREPQDLCLNILGSVLVVSWGPEVTPAQAAHLGKAWSRCLSPKPPVEGIQAEAGTEARPISACLTLIQDESRGAHVQVNAGSFAELAELVSSYLTLRAIEAQAGAVTMLHACGISDVETGGVIALVAKSGTGKTTASRLLGRSLGYVTDETVAIQPDGRVRPYPKPLSVKNGGPYKEQIGPDELGLLRAPAQCYLHGIALLDRRDDWTEEPRVEQVALADAVLALIPDTSSQGRISRPLQSLCELLDKAGGLYRITYGEAAQLPLLVQEMLKKPQEPAGYKWAADFPAADESAGVPAGKYRRAPVEDAIEIEGDLLLLSGEQIARISGIGPSIWEAAASAASQSELASAVTRRHGEPEGYELLVDDAIVHLVEQGVLIQGQD
ncbi:hypothetical protein V1638_00700 [Pseudarthrobacter sp. J64]|uniref:hypothetical protein n=1 Tax=Pseudarthrobacter sp. J64 TaxID=3116485 RepID=UPI002E824239|nr:hypothetical protein [Pseudarthrobacter sp. J64]MEE2567919.1 hypothetical protein [Pseudarthrobacter sp. J64]